MKKIFHLIAITVIAFCAATTTRAQVLRSAEGCIPASILDKTQNLDLEGPCAYCTGCTFPDNMSMDTMKSKYNQKGPNDPIFGKAKKSEAEADYNPDPGDTSNVIPEENILSLVNAVGDNIDMQALMECAGINCMFEQLLDSLQFKMTDDELNKLIRDLDIDAINPDADGSINEFWDTHNFTDIIDKDSLINVLRDSFNFECYAKKYFKVANIQSLVPDDTCETKKPCVEGFNNPVKNRSNPLDYDKSEMDLFSGQIKGFELAAGMPVAPTATLTGLMNQLKAAVNLYNGNPQVNVPLMDFVSNDLSVPIGLTNTGKGMKVNEYGTEMGVSWGLNAGGSISRNIKGLPDEFYGETEGSGIGPTPVFKPCVAVVGGSVTFYTKRKLIDWSWEEPTVVHVRPTIATITIPVAWFVIVINFGIDIKVELNVRYKPDNIKYEETGVGLKQVETNSTTMWTEFVLPSFKTDNIDLLSATQKNILFNKASSHKSLDDMKFLSPKVGQIVSWMQAIQNLFGDIKEKTKSIDLERDEFMYNFGNYSGKFIINYNVNESNMVTQLPENNLRITPYYESFTPINGKTTQYLKGFQVRTPEGIEYEFGKYGAGGTEDALEYSYQTNYVLPNYYAYPEQNIGDREHLGPVGLMETSLPFQSLLQCYPRSLKYGTTYENGFTIKRTPRYTSTWHLKKIYSLITQEEIIFTYADDGEVTYYSNKSFTHDIPNFDIESGALTCNFDNPFYQMPPDQNHIPGEWGLGKSSFVYQVSQSHEEKKRLIRIDEGREKLAVDFIYDKNAPDIIGNKLCTEIRYKIEDQMSKGWRFEYTEEKPAVTYSCNIADTLTPTVSIPEEFKIDLGPMVSKNDFYYNSYLAFLVGVTTPAPEKQKFWIPLPLLVWYSYVGHHRYMTEFGSLMQIKGFAKWDGGPDLTKEEAMFNGERQRVTLKRVLEIGRDNSTYPILDIGYKGGDEGIKLIPKRFSMNQDLWGYWNRNESRGTLLPAIKYVSEKNLTLHDITNVGANQSVLKGHIGFKNTDPVASVSYWLGHNESADQQRCITGAIEQLTFETQGYYKYDYELNDWNGGSLAMTKGAGFRVRNMTEVPNHANSPAKSTDYTYEQPTVMNRPMRRFQYTYNANDYEKQHYIRLTSNAQNDWQMNQSNYVGYGKVTESYAGNGRVVHTFETPVHVTGISYGVVSNTLRFAGVINLSSEATLLDHPFDDINQVSNLNRIGFELSSTTKDEAGTTIEETVNTYSKYQTACETCERIISIKLDAYSRNKPGPFEDNKTINELFSYGTQYLGGYLGQIISFITQFSSFVHPFRVINKDFVYRPERLNYNNSPWYLSHTEHRRYYGGSVSETKTDIEYTNLFAGEYVKTAEQTVYTNGHTTEERTRYTKSGLFVFDPLKNTTAANTYISANQLILPLQTESYLDGTLYAGSSKGMDLTGGRLVAQTSWSVMNGSLNQTGRYYQHNSDGLPERYMLIKFGGGDYGTPYEFTWNANRLLTDKKYDDFIEEYTYTSLWELATKKDVNDINSSYQYDTRGRLYITKANNNKISNTYTYTFTPTVSVKNVTSFADGSPSQTYIQYYDGLGKPVVKRRNITALLEELKYDEMNRVIYEKKIGGGAIEHEYSKMPDEELVKSTDAVGNVTRYSYGGASAVPNSFTRVSVTDPNGHTSTTTNDGLGNILRSVTGEGGVTQYAYDSKNRLTTVTNPIGETYTYSYNAMDKVYRSRKPVEGADSKVFYDSRYRPRVRVDANGNLFVINYDDFNRITNILKGGGPFTDPGTGIADDVFIGGLSGGANQVYEASYEANRTWLANTEEAIFGNGGITGAKGSEYTFDAVGRLITTTSLYNANKRLVENLTYNDADKAIRKVTDYYPDLGNLTLHYYDTYDYTFNGNLQPYQTYLTTDATPQACLSALSYNAEDQLVLKQLAGPSGTYQNIDYYYDAAGKLILINDPQSTECMKNEEYCDFETEWDIDYEQGDGFLPCSKAISVYIGPAGYYNFPTTVTLPDQYPLLETYLNNAISDLGLYGTAIVTLRKDLYKYHLKVVFTGINADDISMNFQNCRGLNLTKGDCCKHNESGGEGPTDYDPSDLFSIDDKSDPIPLGGGGGGGTLDLFAEKIDYQGLNIRQIEYINDCISGKMRNEFTYDADHRVRTMTNTMFTPAVVKNRYDESYTYDAAGNIASLSRNGLIDAGTNTYGAIDDLAYTYSGGNTSKLLEVADNTPLLGQWKGLAPGWSTYDYDLAGNITTDGGKNLTITYNPLSLPEKISELLNTIQLEYTLSGEKVRKLTSDNGFTEDRIYFGEMELVDLERESLNHPEGRITFGDTIFTEYYMRDHLGNTMLTFADKNGDGVIDPVTEVTGRHYYYAFGLDMEGEWSPLPDLTTPYGYNGKELNKHLGLNWLDYDSRWYIPEIGRFSGIDPVADQFAHVSPYNYAENMVPNANDLWGLQMVSPQAMAWGQITKSVTNAVKTVTAFVAGVANSTGSNGLGDPPGMRRNPNEFGDNAQAAAVGQAVGDAVAVVMGVIEMANGASLAAGGGAATVATGGTSVVVAGAGAAAVVHGTATANAGMKNLLNPTKVEARGKNRLPDEGGPSNGVLTNKPGSTAKKYNKDGKVVKEWNQGHPDHPKKSKNYNDHVHDYKTPGDKSTRQPARTPKKNEKAKDFKQ